MSRPMMHTHCKACGRPLTKEHRKPESSCCDRKCAAKWSHLVRTPESYQKCAERNRAHMLRRLGYEVPLDSPFYVEVPKYLEQESVF